MWRAKPRWRSRPHVAVASLTAHVRASGKWQQYEEQLEGTGVALCLLSYVSVLGLAKHFEMQAAVCPSSLLPPLLPARHGVGIFNQFQLLRAQ